ncbi:hypothetical protein GQ457_09G006440 [Hibiscus cannabinus]
MHDLGESSKRRQTSASNFGTGLIIQDPYFKQLIVLIRGRSFFIEDRHTFFPLQPNSSDPSLQRRLNVEPSKSEPDLQHWWSW